MRLLAATLTLALNIFVASAADVPLAGTWKLNAAKSAGPAPACVHDGILRIRPEVYKGPRKLDAAGQTNGGATNAAEPGKCSTVYLFTPSPDGHTLTLTQPHVNPAFKSVFEKQD